MERKKFLASIMAFALTPFMFKVKGNSIDAKGFKINSGDGRIHGHIKLKGVNANVLDLKVSGKDTNGGMAIFEQTSLSQGKGTPLHIHPLQDEVFYVLDGEYFFKVGSEKYRMVSGDSIFMPRNVPHAWTQVSEKGKMTVIFQPAGKMEEFFVTMAGLETEPTSQEIAKIFSENEMQVVGPPLKIE